MNGLNKAFRTFIATIGTALALGGCGGPEFPPSYARVTVHLMHGDEPITMDWVVECRKLKRGGEMRDYSRVTVSPYLFGAATRDGGMVIALAPAYCGISPTRDDYLPILFWGNKLGDFSFLTAYVAEEAFTNPASKLRVVDVSLSPSSADEKKAFDASLPKNVVPAQDNPFLREFDRIKGETRVTCNGLQLIPVLPVVQDLVNAAWPAGHPQYWSPPNSVRADVPDRFYKSINRTFQSESSEFSSGRGAIRRTGGQPGAQKPMIGQEVRGPSEFNVVPVDFDFLHDTPANQRQNITKSPLRANGTINSDDIGMMYCGFYPGLNNTKIRLIFPDGEMDDANPYYVMRSNKALLFSSGFGADVERGGDRYE